MRVEDRRLVLAPHEVEQLGLEAADVLDRDVVEVAGRAGPDRDDLVLDRERRVLRLLEQLDQAGAALELAPWTRLSRSEPKAANASSSRNWARSRRSGRRPCSCALIWAAPPTRDTEMPTLMAGRTPELNRSVSRKIWPSVIEMTLVGM